MENENFLTDVFILGAVLFSWLWIVIAMNRILNAIDELRQDLKETRSGESWHFLKSYEPGTWFEHTVRREK